MTTSMVEHEQPRKRPRHLIDPNAPRVSRAQREADRERLVRVQRWVLSTLAVTTVLHLSAGLIIAGLYLPDARSGGALGLDVIAGAFGVLAVAVGLAIHRRPLLTPWLLLGVIPGIVGVWLTLR